MKLLCIAAVESACLWERQGQDLSISPLELKPPFLPLCHLTLVAIEVYACSWFFPPGQGPTEKKSLNSYYDQDTAKVIAPGAQSFCEGGLLANHDDCSLRARLLVKHVSHGRLWFFPEI